jgi:hypothetical protein
VQNKCVNSMTLTRTTGEKYLQNIKVKYFIFHKG